MQHIFSVVLLLTQIPLTLMEWVVDTTNLLQWLLRWLKSPMQDLHTRPQMSHVYDVEVRFAGAPDFLATRLVLIASVRCSSKLSTALWNSALQLDLSAARASQHFGSMSQAWRLTRNWSLYRLRWPPGRRLAPESWPYSRRLGIRSSDIRDTWPHHLNWVRTRRASMPVILHFSSTDVSGTLSCHLMCSIWRRHLRWKLSSFWMCLL